MIAFLEPAAIFLCPRELDFLSRLRLFDGVFFGLLTVDSVDFFNGFSMIIADWELEMTGVPRTGGGGAQCSRTSL